MICLHECVLRRRCLTSILPLVRAAATVQRQRSCGRKRATQRFSICTGGGELLSSGDTGARGTYKPVSTAQSQTNTRNRELFAEMSGWLTDAAVLPRPPNTINGRDQAHGGPDDEGDVGLGSAMMGDDDY
eukprot:COSAG03_NODE_979_length_5128_cov_7.000398_6_plen_130_part_00